ncbi:hypothetical protein IW137_001404 [Coemansia sp. RSA 1287]|nr:hypothetical protein IW137_001404 [Coemansia sp. RSA 1287]
MTVRPINWRPAKAFSAAVASSTLSYFTKILPTPGTLVSDSSDVFRGTTMRATVPYVPHSSRTSSTISSYSASSASSVAVTMFSSWITHVGSTCDVGNIVPGGTIECCE